jgi:tryptophan-rich sensory protein
MKTIKLLASILLCLAVGAAGSVFTRQAIPTWYATLARPSFAPPNWLFAPVWTLLYILMGWVLYRLWQEAPPGSARTAGLRLFFLQLVLNGIWTPIFFGLRALWPAFVCILALLAVLVWMMRHLWRFDRLSSWLLSPYLLWVSFATVLTFAYARLNS